MGNFLQQYENPMGRLCISVGLLMQRNLMSFSYRPTAVENWSYISFECNKRLFNRASYVNKNINNI